MSDNSIFQKRLEFLRKSRIDEQEPVLINNLLIPEEEFLSKIALLESEERELAIEFRQIKLDEQLIERISKCEESFDKQIPIEPSEMVILLRDMKNRLLLPELKKVIN